MKNIRQKIRQSLNRSGSQRMIVNEIEQAFDYMLPFVEEAEKAREQYYNSPSIQNGARRHELEQKAKDAIEASAQHIWSVWEMQFKSDITEYELVTLMLQTLKRLRPEGEEPIKDDGAYWIRYINNELFQPA